MPERPMTRAIVYRSVATMAFLGLATLGANGGLHDIRSAAVPLERAQAVSQLVYALGSLAIPALIWRRSPLLRWILLVWAAAFCTAGTLAPVVWGGALWSSGAAAGLLTLVVAGALGWLALRAAGNQ
jgi:hypothetical protein